MKNIFPLILLLITIVVSSYVYKEDYEELKDKYEKLQAEYDQLEKKYIDLLEAMFTHSAFEPIEGEGIDPVIPTDKNPEFSTLAIWFSGKVPDVGETYIPGREGGIPMGLFTSGKGTGNYRTYAHMANDTHWFGSHGAALKMSTSNPAFAFNRFKALKSYNSQTPAAKEQWEALAAWGVPKDHYEYYAGFSVKEHMGERKNGVNGYQASIFLPNIPYITIYRDTRNGTPKINPLLDSPNIQWREEKPNNLNQWNWIVTNTKTGKNIRVPSTIANVKPKNNETMEQFKSRLDPNQRRAYEALEEMLWDEAYNSES